MKRETEYLENPLIDMVYTFRGLWDLESQCGLKIVGPDENGTTIIISDLYDLNTGSTVTEYFRPLLEQIRQDFPVDPFSSRIIHFVPDSSKHDFLDERYYEIEFDPGTDLPPKWRMIDKATVMEIVGQG